MRFDARMGCSRSLLALLALLGVACGSTRSGTTGGDTQTNTPIAITLDEPLNLATIRSQKVIVRGSISGVQSGEVLVEEIPVEVVEGRFETAITLREGKSVSLTVLHAPSGTRVVRTLYVDFTPPKLTVSAPERATRQLPPNDQLTVSLQVSDNLELTRLEHEGTPLTVSSDGKAEHQVTLVDGLNTIVFVAVDAAGNRTTRRVNVLYGEVKSPSDVLDAAIRLNVGKVALAVIAEVGQQIVDALDLEALAKAANPLYSSSIVTLTLDKLSYTKPSVLALVPKTGLIEAQVALKDVNIELSAQLDTLVKVTVKADSISVSAQIKPGLDNGVPTTVVENLQVAFDNLSVGVDNADLVNAWPEYKQTIETQLGQVISELVKTYALPLVDQWLPKVVETRTFTFGGVQIELQPVPEVLNVTSEGIYLRMGAKVQIVDAPGGSQSPGYHFTPGDWTAVTTSDHLRLVLRDDLLNLLLHEVWRAGLLSYRIDQAYLDAQKSEVELVAGFLGSIVDDLVPPINPETAIAIVLEAPLPPVLALSESSSEMLRLGLGDFRATVTTVAETPRTLLVGNVTVGLRTGLDFLNEKLVLSGLRLEAGVDIDADVTSSVAAFENFTNLLLAPIGEKLGTLVQPIPLPQFELVRYSDPDVQVVGPNKQHLSLELRLHPAVQP